MKQFRNTDYYITKTGKVYSTKSDKFLSLNPDSAGYNSVSLYFNLKRNTINVHRLVAECYLEDFDSSLSVNHMDLNKLNNHISNLEMVTPKENTTHYKKSLDIKPYNIKISRGSWSKEVETYQQAAQICGYKSRSSITALICKCFNNKNGFIAEKIYI